MISIHNYRQIKKIVSKGAKNKDKLEKSQGRILEKLYEAEDIHRATSSGIQSIREAARDTMRFSRELQDMDEYERDSRNVEHAFGGSSSFVHMHANFAHGILGAWQILVQIANQFDIPDLEDIDEDGEENLTKRERLADISLEQQVNGPSVAKFTKGLEDLPAFRHSVTDLSAQMLRIMEKYFVNLTDRHGKMGLKVWHTPILTDFALTIFENIRHHGEVSKESSRTEISAYSRRKAIELIEWIKNPDFKDILISDSSSFSYHIRSRLRDLTKFSKVLEELYSDEMGDFAALKHRRIKLDSGSKFESNLRGLEDMDPNRVKYRDLGSPMTEQEIHDLEFKNEVIGEICSMLKDEKSQPGEIADYVWEKCKELQNHYLVDNSFYQCRISQGNPMLGQGSGHLEVVPGKKPYASFDRIVGSGFEDVKKFVDHIKALKKWSPLYLMTSPRKSVDRNNVLLIGPQGCGKTECMRAVANEEDSIAIFAQGSDFLTAWMGEAQKNPKRLFEAAIKLHKESGRHVHILIDEIDSVLNNDWSTGKMNLSLEFQMIMDGVVEYPGVSVWGTTNSPDRIPMPMIRRFSLVSIVGKLDQEQRVHLLKQFMSVLPLSDDYTEEIWNAAAKRLEGATGDVVRKICENVWRREISRFIEENPDDADRMLDVIKNQNQKNQAVEQHDADKEKKKYAYGGTVKTTKREDFLKRLSKVFTVSAASLKHALDMALDNVGIINEIDTAKRTYEEADKFLAQVKENRGDSGHAANVGRSNSQEDR